MQQRPEVSRALQLRGSFPLIPYDQFFQVVREFQDYPELLPEVLQEVQEQYAPAQQEFQRQLTALQARLRVGETHHLLDIQVPGGVDLVHAQAIVVYGFLMPGSTFKYIGANCVPAVLMRTNVNNKLTYRFNLRYFETCLAFLLKQGVILTHTNHNGLAYSLNSREKDPSVSPEGAAIIVAAKRFLNS